MLWLFYPLVLAKSWYTLPCSQRSLFFCFFLLFFFFYWCPYPLPSWRSSAFSAPSWITSYVHTHLGWYVRCANDGRATRESMARETFLVIFSLAILTKFRFSQIWFLCCHHLFPLLDTFHKLPNSACLVIQTSINSGSNLQSSPNECTS